MYPLTIRANPGCSSGDLSSISRTLHGIAVICISCERSGRKALRTARVTVTKVIVRTSPKTTLDGVLSLSTVETKEQKKG